jgi:hypothetical protein
MEPVWHRLQCTATAISRNDGAAVVTLDPAGTILLPNIPPDALHLHDGLRFIHGHR